MKFFIVVTKSYFVGILFLPMSDEGLHRYQSRDWNWFVFKQEMEDNPLGELCKGIVDLSKCNIQHCEFLHLFVFFVSFGLA